MKKNILSVLIIGITILGLISASSCKRGAVEDPSMGGPAGFYITLSGTANPSTIYISASEGQVGAVITVRALNNDGTPAGGYPIIFEEGGYGFFDGYKISDTRTTNANGVASINYFIPSAANIKATVMTNITATLVDDGRLDNLPLTDVNDIIPVRIVPYYQQGLTISGHVTTSSGTGVEGVTMILTGTDGNISSKTVTRSSGSYEFLIPSGWYGIVAPEHDGYGFAPENYEFTSVNPIYHDRTDIDFTAIFSSGNNLAATPSTLSMTSSGGTATIQITNSTGDASIGYSVTIDVPWIEVSSSSGSTPGTFDITVFENLSGEDRSGEVTVTAMTTETSEATIKIDQLGDEVSGDSVLAADITTINATYEGGIATINVYNSTTADNIDYIITPSAGWFTLSATSGTTDDSFTIDVPSSTEEARTATVTLTPITTGVSNSVVIVINQDAGPSLAVDPEVYPAGSGVQVFQATVTNPTTDDVLSWVATNGDSWITLSPSSGNTGATVDITIQTANPTSAVRYGTIIFTASNGATATLRIEQAGS